MTALDPARQKQAKEYARSLRRVWLIEVIIGGAYASVWLLMGWSTALRGWLVSTWSFFENPWWLIPAYVFIFGGIFVLMDLPISYFGGFILPQRFGQSTQSLAGWISDQLKGILIGTPIGLLLLELFYLALRTAGGTWWLWAAGGLLIFNVLFSNLAPVLILPLFNRYVPLGDEHEDLAKRLLRLAEFAHTKVQGVYTFDMSRRSKAANAALMGIGNTRRVVVSDTLVKEFTPDEIETVLAHELGHQVHGDIPILIAFGTVSTLVGLFLASQAMLWAVRFFGFAGIEDIAAFPALILVLGIYGLLTLPVDNAFSRWRESLADSYALTATGKNETFSTALVRLANQNLGEVDPDRWVVIMFYSHPPLAARIRAALDWKEGAP
jgi:STE24 endopeptidase